MLVWLGVIRYLGFFAKYNVSSPSEPTRIILLPWLKSREILMPPLTSTAPYPDPAGSPAQRHQILLLCCYDLPRLLLLWMDCTGPLPWQGTDRQLRPDSIKCPQWLLFLWLLLFTHLYFCLCSSWPWTHICSQDDLDLLVLLPLSPKCWHDRFVSTHINLLFSLFEKY